MRKLFSLLSIFAIVLSCSSDETSTPVTPPPAPIVKYTITLSAGEGGTVSTTGGEFEEGQTVSVTATPQGEYLFKDWSDGNTNATRTITVSSNSTLTANFEKRKYPLTLNIEGEGEVLEEIVNTGRTTDYDSGTTVKLTALPSEGWEFVAWTGDIESTELEVQLLVSEAKEIFAEFIKPTVPFKTLSERFSNINETTSYFNENYYFKNYIYIKNDIYQKIIIGELGDETHWRPLSEFVKFSDVNGDGKVDMFVFMSKVENGFGVSPPGKYVIYSDVYRDDFDYQNPITIESDVVFGGDITFQDFDNDGINDVLIGAYQDHNNDALPNIDLRILFFNKDFSYEEVNVGFVSNQHSLSTGDVNNDGLVDIVQIGFIGVDDNLPDANYPNAFINIGGRVFNKIELLSDIDDFRKEWDQFNILYYDLFDLNNDGFLDLLCGQDLVNDKWVDLRYEYNDKLFQESMEGPFILWGNGTGQFSYKNITYTNNVSFNYSSEEGTIKIMGGGFTDFDNDGDVDFVISSELQEYGVDRKDLTGKSYDNYILTLYQNNGDNSFTDISKQHIDFYYKFNPYEFNWFKRISSLDKDQDGDFDLVPRSFNGVYDYSQNTWIDLYDNMFWEKSGSFFTRNETN